MDGFPLDLAQASSFVQMIGPPSVVIYLDVSQPLMEFRLKTRNNFDDTPESIQKKISTFNEKSKTLIQEWKATKVEGNGTEKEVYESIKTALIKQNMYKEVKLNVNIG